MRSIANLFDRDIIKKDTKTPRMLRLFEALGKFEFFKKKISVIAAEL